MIFSFLATLPIGELRGPGKLGNPDPGDAATAMQFENTLSRIIGVLTVAAILWFVLQIFLAAYSWISSGGDAKALEAARSKLINAIVGILIVFIALIFTSVIGGLLGVEVLNISAFIQGLNPSNRAAPPFTP